MNVTNLKADIDFLCGSTSATYPDADKIRNINIAYQDVARLIWESADGWQYDDSNNTDQPIVRRTLVDNTQEYSIPTTAQRIERIEVMDNAGDWHKLDPIDMHDIDIGLSEWYQTAGLPKYYDLVGQFIRLYPKPASSDVTLVSGMAVYVSRDVTEFGAGATTGEPGFATAFHRILSYAASLDFLRDDNEKQFLALQKQRLEQGLVRFYSKRNNEYKTRIKPAGKKNWRQYI